ARQTLRKAARGRRFSLLRPVNCEGKRILSANLLSGKRGGAVDHAAREKAARGRKKIERHQCDAHQRTRSGEAGGKKIGDADRCTRIEAPRCSEARKQCGVVRIRRLAERAREVPGV